MSLYDKALVIAHQAHSEQVDLGGVPYVYHCLFVASKFKDEVRKVVGLLHDVLEHSEISLEDLRNEGFPEVVLEALRVLWKVDLDYLDYIEKVRINPIARDVKLEDLRHNMELNRLDEVTLKDLYRVNKYRRALKSLLYEDEKE